MYRGRQGELLFFYMQESADFCGLFARNPSLGGLTLLFFNFQQVLSKKKKARTWRWDPFFYLTACHFVKLLLPCRRIRLAQGPPSQNYLLFVVVFSRCSRKNPKAFFFLFLKFCRHPVCSLALQLGETCRINDADNPWLSWESGVFKGVVQPWVQNIKINMNV